MENREQQAREILKAHVPFRTWGKTIFDGNGDGCIYLDADTTLLTTDLLNPLFRLASDMDKALTIHFEKSKLSEDERERGWLVLAIE